METGKTTNGVDLIQLFSKTGGGNRRNFRLKQAAEWLRAPSASLLHCGVGHAKTLFDLARAAKIRGGQFHDARIAAICIENGVTELWTADRDFSRFPQLKTRNPLVAF